MGVCSISSIKGPIDKFSSIGFLSYDHKNFNNINWFGMKKFILTVETDPRCIEYYIRAFPELSLEDQEQMRSAWVGKMVGGS